MPQHSGSRERERGGGGGKLLASQTGFLGGSVFAQSVGHGCDLSDRYVLTECLYKICRANWPDLIGQFNRLISRLSQPMHCNSFVLISSFERQILMIAKLRLQHSEPTVIP